MNVTTKASTSLREDAEEREKLEKANFDLKMKVKNQLL